jgi:polysaccharide biosynthesis/export protein
MNSQITRILLCVFIVIQIVFSDMSCISARKTVYFYNVKDTTFLQLDPQSQTPIHENDILSISISSLNESASAIFNKPNENVRRAATSTGVLTESSGYLVNTDGYIQLPILGNIKAAGLTKS